MSTRVRISQMVSLVFAMSACGSRPVVVVDHSLPAGSGSVAAGPVATVSSFVLADQARAGVDDPELAALLVDHWDWSMRDSPVTATTRGDHRFDDRISDLSAAHVEQLRAERDAFISRAREISNSGRLSSTDRVTLDLFVQLLEADKAMDVCETHLWFVSPRDNPLTDFNVLPEFHRIETVADGRNLLARYRAIPRAIDQVIDNLRAGARRGLIANAETLRRTVAMVEGQLAKPVQQWAIAAPASVAREGWTAAQTDAFAHELTAVVTNEVKPAYSRYRDLLLELVARGRGPRQVGLGSLPAGASCYRGRLRYFTGLAKTADDIHQTGLDEISRINEEMVALGRTLFATDNLKAIAARLRTDRSLYFTTKEEILEAAEKAVARARAAVPRYFGILPQSECVVSEIPDYEAPYTTIAYYVWPHSDGSKPGEYFINTFKPQVRPRFEMEVLAYHEAIPGHHLQIAIAQERDQLPAFRRFEGSTAFVEGWALYTERLSDEMGLYSGDLDRMGMLSYDAWRAARLVVDTGIHAKGWTRRQAEEYMLAHTALTAENITNEVDRYISWPGQAVAYKIGQLEIFRLRRLAEQELGAQFDIKAFHDVVLSNGAVTLPVLERAVRDYIGVAKS